MSRPLLKHGSVSLFLIIVCFACHSWHAKQTTKKIFYINSYHTGYPASDEVMKGMDAILKEKGIDFKTYFLDTKNKPDSIEISRKVEEVLDEIKNFDPDLIIVSDDAAVKYVIVPYFRNSAVPVVFCGVNWSAVSYGLPVKNITGMLEVLPLRKNLQTMRAYYPAAKKLTVLSEKSLSEEKNKELLDTLYRNMGFSVHYEMAEDFIQWKKKFIEAGEVADIIYLPTNGSIKGWDNEDAKNFVQQHITKPVITCDDFMMPYCVYGLTKVAKEQGIWAANTAIDILNGKAPAAIAVTENKESQSFINDVLARKIGFKPDSGLLKSSNIIH